jgi:hypothetical protein
VVSFTSLLLYPWVKSPLYPLDRRLGGRSGQHGEEKILDYRVIKSRMMRWLKYVIYWGRCEMCTKLESRRPFGCMCVCNVSHIVIIFVFLLTCEILKLPHKPVNPSYHFSFSPEHSPCKRVLIFTFLSWYMFSFKH